MQKLRDELAFSPKVKWPEWDSFEFITLKKGANGPTKTDCLNYYQNCQQEKLVKIYFTYKSLII